MMLALGVSAAAAPTMAAAPEPVDPDFLDYLATVEGKDDNWTVVATDKERKKARAAKEAKPRKPPADTVAPKEARP